MPKDKGSDKDQDKDKDKSQDQDKDGPKLLYGKYKSEDEVTKALQNLERRVGELSEDNKFLTEELEQVQLEGTKTRDDDGTRKKTRQDDGEPAITTEERKAFFEKPDEVLTNFGNRLYKKIMGDVSTGVGNREALSSYQQTLNKAFYQDNQDLVGRELIVGAVARQIQSENPKTPPHRLLGQISQRSREYLEGLTKGSTDRGTRSEDDETRGGNPPKKTESAVELEKTLNFQAGR